MRGIVLILAVASFLSVPINEASAQEPTQIVSLHFVKMQAVRTGVVSLRNVHAVAGSTQVEAEEAELSMSAGRLRLVLKGGGTVTLPKGAQVEVVTGPDRNQRDDGLTNTLRLMLSRTATPRRPEFIMSGR